MFSSVLGEQHLESFRSSWGTNMSAVISTNCVLALSGSLQNSILQPTINQLMLKSPIIITLTYSFARFNVNFQPNTSKNGTCTSIQEKQLVILKNLLPNIHHKTLLDIMKKMNHMQRKTDSQERLILKRLGPGKLEGTIKKQLWSIFQ